MRTILAQASDPVDSITSANDVFVTVTAVVVAMVAFWVIMAIVKKIAGQSGPKDSPVQEWGIVSLATGSVVESFTGTADGANARARERDDENFVGDTHMAEPKPKK